MTRKEKLIVFVFWLIFVLFAILCFYIGFLIASAIVDYLKPRIKDPESIECKIDSLNKVNDGLILEITNLEDIKNVEIIEVKHLDNDSTLKLFYKLIRE